MKIAFLITQNMLVTSFSNAYELMMAAIAKARAVKHPLANDIQIFKVAQTRESIEVSAGVNILADMSISDQTAFDAYDMIFVPALWRNPRPFVRQQTKTVAWLRRQWENGAIINATGTGVCLLAESGILDGQVATTHWHHFDAFEHDYPLVNLKRHHFITGAGKLFCAASINAQTDLVLHHVHRFIGQNVSEHLSRHFSHEVRQPYDQLSFDREKQNAHPDESILEAQLWIQNHISQTQLKLDGLAQLVGMSKRNFNRRFRNATGYSPIEYLQIQRQSEAKDLLKNSNLNIGEIAYRVGYLDVSYFSKQFKTLSGVTPKQWRSSVRAKLFN